MTCSYWSSLKSFFSINKFANSNTPFASQRNFAQLQKNEKKQVQTGDTSQSKLVVMWLLMFLGYFMFCLQWYSISNFSGGWSQAFYSSASTLVGSVPNWIITFGRSIGSILAGWFIAKLGHKYAVVLCLTLMVISFPFIIVAQNAEWNTLSIDGGAYQTPDAADPTYLTAVPGFSLFVIFRIFLAVGGTTLITYTNSVIAKMPPEKKTKHITLNNFGFGGGAFIGNIFFVIPGSFTWVKEPAVWTGFLSAFVVIIAIICILYILLAVEVVPRTIKTTKQFSEKDKMTFKRVLQFKDNYVLYGFYAFFLFVLVFTCQAAFRSFIETSPANLVTLVEWNVAQGNGLDGKDIVTSISAATSDYNYVWPLFISLFVGGYVVSAFTVTKFNKTNFSRKTYIMTLITLGVVSLLIGYLLVYFCGYSNVAALIFFFVFAFIAGVFLWGVQPVILFIPQQQERTSPEYVGTVAGLVWGLGYLGYTVLDAVFSSISSYAGLKSTSFATAVTDQVNAINAGNQTVAEAVNTQSDGLIATFAIFWILMVIMIAMVMFFPKTGFRKNGVYTDFTKKWNPLNFSHWKFSDHLAGK